MIKTDNYCITKQNVWGHEIIGLKAVVKKSPDKTKTGLRGKIIYETKNTITIETKIGEKKLGKKEVLLELSLGKEKVLVDGNKILARPEDRTKMFWRKYHGKMQ